MDFCIIGGGFFGLYLAHYLQTGGGHVKVFEKEKAFMTHASYNNQARVHNGYHYPRSVLTALRSRISFPRFIKEFSDCIYSDFDKYYMVGRPLGKITAEQFYQFCRRIGAEIEPAPHKITTLVNSQYIEAVYTTKEFAFDAHILRDTMLERLNNKVELNSGVEVIKVSRKIDGKLLVTCKNQNNEVEIFTADHVFNCSYSRINALNTASGLEVIPLKHEMTEMCLVEVPDILKSVGITVMCGPFFSVMPFPSVHHNGQIVHSFSHVRYTPHYEWYDKSVRYIDAHTKLKHDERHTCWKYMLHDAERFIPCLKECKRIDSLWEIKTVLPRSETDDSRPILCQFNHGIRGYHCVMGGKIDNIYDAVEAIKKELGV